MSAANSRAHAVAGAATIEIESKNLFKEDRPRRIDRFISFFGDSHDEDASGAESFSPDRWSER